MVKNRLPVQETQVQSLGWEDPLEEEIAIHSHILAWKIPWPRVRQAIVRGVAKGQTWLKQLSTAQHMRNKIQKGYKPTAKAECCPWALRPAPGRGWAATWAAPPAQPTDLPPPSPHLRNYLNSHLREWAKASVSFFLKLKKFIFIYLSSSGLSCCTQNLSLWYMNSLTEAHGLSCPEAHGSLAPQPGIEPAFPA